MTEEQGADFYGKIESPHHHWLKAPLEPLGASRRGL
jgi:hypothetical protein